MRCSLFAWSHFRTENRLPPRIKSGAGFFLKMLWLGRPFPRGAGMDRERVHAAFELARQRLVYHSVALDPALSFECLGHDIDPEMGLAARPMPGMPEVLVRFIDHLETFGGESQRQLLRDQIAPRHGLRIWGSRAGRSMADRESRKKGPIALVKSVVPQFEFAAVRLRASYSSATV